MATATLQDVIDELKDLKAVLGPMSVSNSPFLTVKEAAELARCTKHSIRNLIYSGKLTRCGFSKRRTCIRRDELMALMESPEFSNGYSPEKAEHKREYARRRKEQQSNGNA